MKRSNIFFALVVLPAAALLAIAGVSAAPDATMLGQTLAGESCQLAGSSDILCGAANDQAGTLRS
ncbi:MAG: hypothetical protein ACREMY_30655, partial [bacterium]